MATTVTNPDKFKFLDYIGLQELVNKIKGLIEASKTATSIEKVEYDAATRKFTLTQGGTTITSDAIAEVSASNSGLMTSAQLDTLNNVNANKVQRVCVSVDGSQVADTLRYDFSTANDKLAIIDYTTKLGELTDVTRKQAPTAGAVKDALDTKVNTEDYNKDKATFALESSVQERFNALGETYYTETEIDAKVDAINKAITDGDNLKVNVSDFDTYKAEQKSNNETQGAAIKGLQDFVGVAGKTSTNVYNKSEVDAAIAGVKSDILGGDITQALKDYDTIKEIAEWITSDETGAAGLAAQVATNTADIATNKANIEANDKDIADLQAKDLAIDGEIADLKEADEALDLRVDALEETVGDSTKGLVKDVADLKTTVGTATAGLVKDVADLKGVDESLIARLNVIEGDGAGSIKNAIATSEAKAVGSLGEIKLAADGNYKMEVKSVADTVLQTVVFETFTTADIDALFA